MRITSYIAAFAALIPISCSRNDVNTDIPYDIVYEVMAGAVTKTGEVTTNDYPENLPFGVWAYALPADKKWGDSRGEAELVMDNVKAVHMEERLWRPENGQKWASSGERMSFFAAAPYGRAGFDPENGVYVESYSLDEGGDLMYVSGQLDRDKRISNGKINLTFSPALAEVSFNAQMSLPKGHSITVRKLTISGVRTEGSFMSEPHPYWHASGIPEEVVLFEGAAELQELPKSVCRNVPMIPQVADTELVLLCDIGNGVGVLTGQRLKARCQMAWNPGKHCSYTLKVTHNLEFTAEKDPK